MVNTQQEELTLDIPKIDIPSVLEQIILWGIVFILALPLLSDNGLWLFPIGRDIIFTLAVEFLWVLFFIKTTLTRRSQENIKDVMLSSPSLMVREGVRGASYKQKVKKTHFIILSLTAFWLVMLFSTLTSVQPDFSLWGNIYKNQGFITWTHYLLFFFLLIVFIGNKSHWRLLINASIAVASVVSLVAIWQMLENNFAFRVMATLSNSNYLSAYLVLLLPITATYFLRNKSWLFASATILQFLALLFTQTRGGYLGIVVAISIFILLYLKYLNKSSNRIAKNPKSEAQISNQIKISKSKNMFLKFGSWTWFGICILAFSIFTPPGQSLQQKLPDFTDRFLNIQSIKKSSVPRLEAWRTGWQGILENPLLGYGPENFFVAYDEHYSGFLDDDLTPIELSPWEAWFDKAHNFIFDIGATTGFLGLFAYIAIFISAIWLLLRRLKIMNHEPNQPDRHSGIMAIGVISALGGYLAQNFLGFDTTIPGIYLVFLLAYTSFITTNNKIKIAPLPLIRGGAGGGVVKVVKVSILIIASGLFASSLKIHSDILRANYQLNFAEALAQNGRIEESFQAFEKGLVYNSPPINPNLRRRYAVIALGYYDAVEKNCPLRENKGGSDPPLFRKEKCDWLYSDAESKLKRAFALQQENIAREWPHFTRNYIYAGQIANILGNYEQSDHYFSQAMNLSPKRKSISVKWNELRQERID